MTRRSVTRRRARSSVGVARKMSRQARLSWRTLPKPLAKATSATVRSVSSRRRRAKWAAARARQLVGRDAEVLGEQPAQVAGGHAEPGAEVVLGALVEGAVADHAHGPAHELRAAEDGTGAACGRAGSAGRPGTRRPRRPPPCRRCGRCRASAGPDSRAGSRCRW